MLEPAMHRCRTRLPATALAAACVVLLAACAAPRTTHHHRPAAAADVVAAPHATGPADETPQGWYRSGALRAAANGAMAGNARNVILFLGDGMSLTTVAAARILEGQRTGGRGEENLLGWEHFPHTGFSKTYNTDAQTPDSAGTMTAITTGVKTHAGAIGVSAGNRHDCADSSAKHLLTWLQLADSAGMGAGIV